MSPGDDARARLAERLWWFTTGGDPAPLLDDAALDESQAAVQAAVKTGPDGEHEVVDLRAVAVAALAHWYRYTALPKGRCEGDYLRSHSLARVIGLADPSQITVGLRVHGERQVVLDTVDAAVQWARHVAGRFDRSGDQEQLAEMVDHLRARIAVQAEPRLLDAFVTLVYRQFLTHTEHVWLLEESVAAARRSLGLTARDDPRRDDRIYALGAVLDVRTKVSPQTEAVELLRALASRTADDDPVLPAYLLALSRALTDADEVIAVLGRAVEVSQDPELELLVAYAEALSSRAPTGPQEAAKALVVRRAIVDRLPPDHRDRHRHLVALANMMLLAGENEDEAIGILRSVTADDSWRAQVQTLLSTALGNRFDHRGDDADLDEAISLAREAAASSPVDSEDGLAANAALGLALLRRFEHFRGRTDVIDACGTCARWRPTCRMITRGGRRGCRTWPPHYRSTPSCSMPLTTSTRR
ncbi:hypothetical protein FXN61_40270 [Lentzea sp. PSKA42]|uniref:Tetratricopeptide repeat-containing protein n=1 Tax=Lentzea indica TaxID=2604800 RepID=A0ABX1FUB0_9PSEU|nr:hypothetical protein [Lentzea indica]NKE62633.1 hypothetical protein [Lentzea indica]